MLIPRDRWLGSGRANGLLGGLLYRATGVPTASAVAASLSAIFLLAAADLALGPYWSLGLFYYLPIAFAAWRLGGAFGVAASVASAIVWALIGLKYGTIAGGTGAAAWAVTSRAVSFGIGAVIVAEMRRLFDRERGLARHCHLTGALSGRAFRDVLDVEVALAARERAPIALVYTDLDDFKDVNDALGHAAGDEMLRRFAQSAEAALGGAGHVARIGGDEFVLLLTGSLAADRERVARLATQIAGALADGPHPISATMGAILVPPGISVEPGALVRRADAAMYEAKRQGKSGLCMFELGGKSALAVAA